MKSIQKKTKFYLFLLIMIIALNSGCIVDNDHLVNLRNSSSTPVSITQTQIPGTPPFTIQAERIIQNFTGSYEPNLTFTGIRNYTYADLYGFESGNNSFWVNNVTRRVQSMSSYNTELTTKNETFNIDSGLLIAESYAREKCPEFWDNEKGKVIKKISQTAKDHELAYSWRQYFVLQNSTSNDSPDIAGFNLIDVSLDARDGKVKSYHEWYFPNNANPDMNPDLSEEQAWEKVKKYFEDKGIGTLDISQRNDLGLVIAVDDNNLQHVAWQFEIKTDKRIPNYYGGQIIVDAHDGQIVRHIRFG